MPLINSDVKSLELVAVAELSGDEVLKREIREKVDLHQRNQDLFRLPDRVTAKRWIFKLVYGATAYGYATDTDFISVGFTERRWQQVIDEFYNKYKGVGKWHTGLLETVRRTGCIEIPSGRFFPFTPDLTRGHPRWPITTIKNYPVQGLGADLVLLARTEFMRRFKRSGLEGLFIGTVHDSLVVDAPSKNVEPIARMLQESVAIVPELCYTNWEYKFSLPLTSEIKVGMNKRDMKELVLH